MNENFGIPLADGRRICRISYADYTILLSETEKRICEMLDYIQREGKKYSIELNATKTVWWSQTKDTRSLMQKSDKKELGK